jgi:hypothetical protein
MAELHKQTNGAEKKTGRSTIAPAGQPSPTRDVSRLSNQNVYGFDESADWLPE